jgi:hypothetical protein
VEFQLGELAETYVCAWIAILRSNGVVSKVSSSLPVMCVIRSGVLSRKSLPAEPAYELDEKEEVGDGGRGAIWCP